MLANSCLITSMRLEIAEAYFFLLVSDLKYLIDQIACSIVIRTVMLGMIFNN